MLQENNSYGRIVLPHWIFLVTIPLGIILLTITAWLNPFPDAIADEFRQEMYDLFTQMGVKILFFIAWSMHVIQALISLYVAIGVKKIKNKTYIVLWCFLTLCYGYPVLRQLIHHVNIN
jgi:hypothetical protein